MTAYSPKQTFLGWEKHASENLQARREDTWLTVSITYALAELAYSGASAEQLAGARHFITVLQNLWEKTPEPSKMPAQTLKSFDGPGNN
jgi:hypothetical protein